MERLKLKLNSAESKDVFRALMELRNQCKRGGVGPLVQGNLLDHLLPLLDRTNTKIIDLSLSIIANLLLDGGARSQFRTGGGVTKLVKIINNIEDPDILRRGFRAVANASLDSKLCRLLHQNGLASTLGKRLQCSSDENTLIVLVRCVRIVADSVQYRTWLFEENIYEKLGLLMLDQGSGSGLSSGSSSTGEEDESTKSELTQTLLKTIAKLTHGASVEQAEKIMPAAAVIAELSKNTQRDIWENSLMILVNLSQHSTLRPSLGNAGGVGCLIDKFNSGDLSSKETGHVITALCLYCRESVNRVKLRELGGCKVLVSVLENNLTHLHNRVVNSLLQFMYDNHSLNVFMSVGLIYSLVRFIEQQNNVLQGTSNCSKKPADEQKVAEDVIEEIKSVSDETGEPAKCSEDKKTDIEKVMVEEKVKDPELKEGVEEKVMKLTGPVFRINSPSYQAVQYELEQFLQMRDTHGSASPRSGLPDYSPASPSSLLQSPDRSPLYLSCGYSPDRSALSPEVSGFSSPTSPRSPSPTFRFQPDFSPPSSPPLSPPEASYSPPHPSSFSPSHSTYSPPLPSSSHMSPPHPSYSPVETFSDDESETSALEPSTSTESNLPAEETTDAERTSAIPETTELPESQGSFGRKPPDDSSTPTEKKIKLSVPELPVYKYSASPITSQFIQKIILPPSFQEELRMVSESREGVEVKEKNTPDCERLDWILQILSRLTQADRPHEDLTSTRTLSCLITLMRLDSDSLGRVTRILSRLSSNLYCLFPFLLQRHASWIMLQIEQVGDGTCCKTCKEHDLNVMKTLREVLHNLTLLTETGYGEGEICHRLVNPTFSQADKQNISVSATLLVKQRRKLQNILINHDSLETLLDIVEQEKGDLLRDAVLSLSVVAGHLGIVSPMLTLVPEEKTPCTRTGSLEAKDLVLVLDDKSEIEVGREFISSASPVFAAMLGGGFKESTKSRISIPMTSKNALNCVVHHLYKCSWCSVFHKLTAQEQLELLSLSDKFLLPELNMRISHQIIRGCLHEGFLLQVYTNSLQREYPVRCSESSLSACTVSTVLVGEMSSVARSGLVSSLIHSTLSSDFLDDVNKMLRKSLMSGMN